MSILLWGAAIALVIAVHFARRIDVSPMLTFWLAYVLTRPLGANIGDFLANPHADGGLGLGTFGTSVVFLLAILSTVTYLSVTRVDRTEVRQPDPS